MSRLTATFSTLVESRGFRAYYLAQFASNIGTRMQMAGTAWYVLALTGSPTQTGLILAAEVLPLVLLSSVAGRFVDGRSAKRVTVVTQMLLALTVAGIAAAAWLNSFPAIAALSIVFGTVAAFDGVARQTFMVELIPQPHLRNAMALNSVSANGSALIGPAVAGFAIAWVGAAWCFVANGLTFVLVALVIATVKSPGDPATEAARPPQASTTFREGLQFVWRIPAARSALVMAALVAAFTYEFPITLPLLAQAGFGDGAVAYGIMLSASGVGSIVGGLKLAGDAGERRFALPLSALGLGVTVLVTAVSPNVWFALAALFFVGALSSQFISLASTALFNDLPNHYRGRASALWQLATVGTTAIGGPVVGLIASAVGPRWSLAVGGAAAILAALVGFLAPPRTATAKSAPIPEPSQEEA